MENVDLSVKGGDFTVSSNRVIKFMICQRIATNLIG